MPTALDKRLLSPKSINHFILSISYCTMNSTLETPENNLIKLCTLCTSYELQPYQHLDSSILFWM